MGWWPYRPPGQRSADTVTFCLSQFAGARGEEEGGVSGQPMWGRGRRLSLSLSLSLSLTLATHPRRPPKKTKRHGGAGCCVYSVLLEDAASTAVQRMQDEHFQAMRGSCGDDAPDTLLCVSSASITCIRLAELTSATVTAAASIGTLGM